MISIKHTVEWILRNRGTKVFQGYDEVSLALTIMEKAEQNLLFYVTNADGQLVGILIADKKPESNTILVLEALTTAHGALRAIVNIGRSYYPEYELEAVRRGKLKTYNTTRLYQKLTGE